MLDYCGTECETSGKYAPCKISITRAGRGIMVAGWPLVKDATKIQYGRQRSTPIFLWAQQLQNLEVGNYSNSPLYGDVQVIFLRFY